jgi:DNA polymerase
MDLELLQQKAAGCMACEPHRGRLNPVFAKGSPKASVMICGMVPADEENKVGLPFVGRAG